MENKKDLLAFFRDLTSKPREATYDGVQFESLKRGTNSLTIGLFLGALYGIHRRITNGDELHGLYLKVWLPVPVGADLLLEARAVRLEESTDPLDADFHWSATSHAVVAAYMTDELYAAINRLAARYPSVVMTDQALTFGPLS